MDITWLVFIGAIVLYGLWTKRQNTKHMRQLKENMRLAQESQESDCYQEWLRENKSGKYKVEAYIKPPQSFKEAAELAFILQDMKREKS